MSPCTVDGDQRWGKEWVFPSGGFGHVTALTHPQPGPKRRVWLEKANLDYPQQHTGKKNPWLVVITHICRIGGVYTAIQYVSVGTASRPNRVPRQAVGSAAGSVCRCDYQHLDPQASPHSAEPQGREQPIHTRRTR